jgi:large repetitive protein
VPKPFRQRPVVSVGGSALLLLLAAGMLLGPGPDSLATHQGTLAVHDWDPEFTCDLDADPSCEEPVKFEVKDLPGGQWKKVADPQSEGVHDGAHVRITVRVKNRKDKSQSPLNTTVRFKDKGTDKLLPEGEVPVTVPWPSPPQGQELTYEWDTEGFAWDGANPKSDREIEASFPPSEERDDGKQLEPVTGKIKVRPKPIVMVHGLDSNAATWAGVEGTFQTVHPDWKAFAVGDGQYQGTMNTDKASGLSIAGNAVQLASYARQMYEQRDAPQFDLVVHSMGGLISRQYIHSLMGNNPDGEPYVARLVMLGTPNRGSPCADLLYPVLRTVGAEAIPAYQLTPGFAAAFNQTVTNRKGVKFSVMAGDLNLPTCQSFETGDLVVEKVSAWHNFSDVAETALVHTSLHTAPSVLTTFVASRLRQRSGSSVSGATVERPSERRATAGPSDPGGVELAGVQNVQVPVGGQVDHPIVVAGGSALNVVVTAPGRLGSELRRPDGSVASSYPSGSQAAAQPVRVHRVTTPQAGTWTLRLSQPGGPVADATVGGVVEGSALQLDLQGTQAGAGGPVSILATPRNGTTPITGAQVKAKLRDVDGGSQDVTLVDDGANGDGAPGDGTYGATTAALSNGVQLLDATAKSGNSTMFASRAIAQGGGGPGGGGGGATQANPTPGGPFSPGALGATPLLGDKVALRMGLASAASRASRRGALLKLTCPSGEQRCTGGVTLIAETSAAGAQAARRRRRVKRVALGTARFDIPGGRSQVVIVRLSSKGRRLLVRRKRLKVTAKVISRDAAGNTARSTARFSLKAPRGR